MVLNFSDKPQTPENLPELGEYIAGTHYLKAPQSMTWQPYEGRLYAAKEAR